MLLSLGAVAVLLLMGIPAGAADDGTADGEAPGCGNPRACAASVEHERARRDMIDAHNRRLDQVRAVGERIATQPPLDLDIPVHQP